MGLGNSGAGKVFVSIVDGKMAVRVRETDEGAVKRVNKNNKVVYERYYEYLDGIITGLSYDVKNFGAFINIEMDNKYVLSVPFKSSMKRNVVCQLPNVDYKISVRINVFKDKEKGRNVLLMYQNGQMLPFAFTKENPNGMPEAEEKMELGQKKLDYSAVEEFLYNVLLGEIGRFNEVNGIEVETEAEEPNANDF